ncbi:MAG TPA: long-chain fatty acid--CoA ligase [Actinomycetota bacterium]|nr:long-chain fatty acid--CoA ligase [Actinomycetota bacterium]
MMDTQLLLIGLLQRAARLFAKREVVSRASGGVHRCNYGEVYERSGRLAAALAAAGVGPGTRVGTFAWNHRRHLEAYFAVPGMGAVCHTINVRLFPEQVAWIVDHAHDEVVLLDEDLLPQWLMIANSLTAPRLYVLMGADGESRPESRLKLAEATGAEVADYEREVQAHDPVIRWPEFSESRAAFMCYTSGTTGAPKGVVYSHRAMYLHTLVHGLTDVHGISEADVVLPVVPMFHANAWGVPLSATMAGAKQVLPGPAPTPADVVRLIRDEGVTIAAGVPTVWLGVLEAAGSGGLGSLRRIACGGSGVPRSLIAAYRDRFGVTIQQGYGMTETGPLATRAHVKSHLAAVLDEDGVLDLRATQGTLVPGLDMKVVDGSGAEVSWDGSTMGEICLRGPWIASGYYRDETGSDSFRDGWLHTGDVAVVDPEGYVRIVDRIKDLVKSGGEWISSVDLENRIMAHPKVAEAAVIGVPDPKWQERPVAIVVPRPGESPTAEEILGHLGESVAKWQLPDRVEFVEEIPKTSVGKFDKKALREKLTGS